MKEIRGRRNKNARMAVTELSKIKRNKSGGGTMKMREISKKVQERRLKWYRHVSRR